MRSLLFILVLCSSQQLYGQVNLIPYGAVWKYFDAGNEPSTQNANDWNDPNFDDMSWASGPAQLGYGDNDEDTEIADTTLTAYFRHSFTISDTSLFGQLDLNLLYDDGAVVYLNGQEIWRVNMPEGDVDYNTFASSSSGDDAQAYLNLSSGLEEGANLIAVEVHQRSSGSSDISFDFQLVGNPPGLVNVIRGPYLQTMTETSVNIKWRTNIGTASKVRFGLSESVLTDSIMDQSLRTNHDLKLDNLNPNTTYYYQIENAEAVLIPGNGQLYFKTSPVGGSTPPLTFWVLGDCGTANGNQRDVRDAFYTYAGSSHTDGILFLGDNAYTDGTDSEYQFSLFENMYEEKLKNTVAWSCLGNHDGHSANSSDQSGPYYDIFTFPKQAEAGGMSSGTEAYYSFDYANVHFISLDSHESSRSVGGTMYNWCVTDIQNTTAEWIIALWHHPAYSKGSHDSDTEGALKQMRENFVPMLESNGVDLILSGHSHSYERSYFLNGHHGIASTFDTLVHTIGENGDGDGKLDGDGVYEKTVVGENAGMGAVFITAGASGKISSGDLDHQAMYHSVAELGSCILEIENNEMTVKYLRTDDMIEDYFTIIKNPACQTDTVFHASQFGAGSLVDLIHCQPSGSTIYLDGSSIQDTIELNQTIVIDKDLNIIGVNGGEVVLRISEAAPLFQIENGRSVHLQNFKIMASNTAANGRAIINLGDLDLNDITIIEN